MSQESGPAEVTNVESKKPPPDQRAGPWDGMDTCAREGPALLRCYRWGISFWSRRKWGLKFWARGEDIVSGGGSWDAVTGGTCPYLTSDSRARVSAPGRSGLRFQNTSPWVGPPEKMQPRNFQLPLQPWALSSGPSTSAFWAPFPRADLESALAGGWEDATSPTVPSFPQAHSPVLCAIPLLKAGTPRILPLL